MAKKARTDGRTNKGTFAPGVSGRTLAPGKADPFVKEGISQVVPIRMDGWSNFFTGQGILGKDKRQGASFKADELSFDEAMELARGDDLAKRAGETLPKEAFRQGWDLVITAEEGDADEDERVNEILDALHKLGAKTYLKQALAYERFYGGAAILLGVNDGQADLSKPLNLNKVKSLDWLTPLEPRELAPVYGYADPKAPKYGEAEIYRMTSRSLFPSKDGKYSAQTIDIHESRLLIFPGNKVSRYQHSAVTAGWGDSILMPMYRVLRDFNMTWAAAGSLVADFSQAVYKFKDLWETLGSDDAGEFQKRLASMELTRSVINATVIDSEDDFSRTSSSIAGLPELLDKFATRLAAAAEMPLTLLFGTSPGGMNATGESDIRFFYDRVAEYQEERVLPKLKRLIQIVMLTTGVKQEPKKWDVTFRPLWQESAKDKASAMLTQAQADSAWITSGVLSAEEIAAAHWQSGKYNPDITVDFAAREKQEQAVKAPIQQADLNAIDPDHPAYKGSSLDPNGNHTIAPPPGSAMAMAQAAPKPGFGGGGGKGAAGTPGQNPFASQKRKDYSPDQERDERGRFGGSGGGGGGGSGGGGGGSGGGRGFAPSGAILASAASQMHGGGFTVNPHDASIPQVGYSVAIHGDREKVIPGKDGVTPGHIADYLKDSHDALTRDPQAHIGGWYSHEKDSWFLDIPHVEKDIAVAAKAAIEHKQLAIWDLKRKEEISAQDYPAAIAKTGRFHGRIDRRDTRTGPGHGPSNHEPQGNGRRDERAPGQGSQGAGSGRLDFNPNHGEGGRFSESAGSSSSGSEDPQAQKTVARDIAVKAIDAHKQALPGTLARLRSLAGPDDKVIGRVKDVESALEKVVRKPRYRDVSQLQDLTGLRIVTPNMAETKKVVDNLRAHFKIIGEDDYTQKPQVGGYRAHHLIIEDNGLQKEVQIQTQNQRNFQEWSHAFYKPENHSQAAAKLTFGPAISAYADAASARLAGKDAGLKDWALTPVPTLPPEAEIAFGHIHDL